MKPINFEDKNEKPRVRFCHECSNKLRGNHYTVVKFENIDHEFTYHKECAQALKRETRK